MHNDISNTHYLGLPSLVGRSKKRIFGYLKERAIQRIQGWSKKPMSRAEKTVLIKNVAQAIPAYSMQYLLLLKMLCQELEILFNKYWWCTNSGNSKGLNWLSWNNMCMSKARRRLGFKNLYGLTLLFWASIAETLSITPML